MKDNNEEKKLFRKMFLLYLLLAGVGGCAMLWSTLRTQLVDGDMWRKKAEEYVQKKFSKPARRGTIFSSDGKVLATTVPVCDLCLNLEHKVVKDKFGNPKRDGRGNIMQEGYVTNDSAFRANIIAVCKILHENRPSKSIEYYRSKIEKAYNQPKPPQVMYLERRLPYSQWAAIRALPGWEKCVLTKTGEGSVTNLVRAHIYGNLGENTIGLHYTGGYTGLEGYYDSVLRGQDGLYLCRRLTRGVWLPMDEDDGEQKVMPDEEVLTVKRRVDGRSIIATIDTRYQDIAENALRKSMEQYGGAYGCAILMEVSTGYVLACCNLTRDTSGHISEQLWNNIACSHLYEPGSTFKVVSMTSMLNDKSIALDTSKRVRAGGEKNYSATSGTIRDDHGYATDTANLAGVLARSSNIGMCELAWQYYRNRRKDFKEGIQSIFPLGKMNPDLAIKEEKSYIVSVAPDRNFLNLSYGYSTMVTPLQVLTFYNALANDGKMVKPLFCREILDGSHRTDVKPVVLNEHVCSPEIAKQMREMMVGVVNNGTATNIKGTTYGIGGKTGTSYPIVSDHSIRNSSFAGFFPADAPRYTCLVLIEKTSVAGRDAAAPVFKRIADCVVAFDRGLGSVRLQDSGRVARPVATKAGRKQLETIHQYLGMPFVMLDSTDATAFTVFDAERGGYANYQLPKGKVPDCTGMTIRDAMRLCHSVGLKVRFTGQGKVVSQTPKARTAIAKGRTVSLVLKP